MMKRLFMTMLFALVAAAATGEERGFSQEIEWTLAGGQHELVASGLYVFRTAPDQQSSRLLVLTPAGRRLVLTNRLTAAGIGRVTLLDEQTGWSATIVRDYGVTRGSLHELYRAFDPETLKEDVTIRMSLTTSLGTKFTVPNMPYGSQAATLDMLFVERMRLAEAADKLRGEIPEEVKRKLPFLDAALTDDANALGFRTVVEILKGLVGAENAAEQLQVQTGDRVKGLTLTRPEQISFASAFRSVVSIDPLAEQ